MEPLSAAASIIAVVGAARKAAEGLRSLKAIKNAPKELEDLLLEFSQIEIVLQSYKNLPTNFQERSSNLATILGIAENKFHELDNLIHYTLTKAGSNEQVDRLQWIRKRSDTERLREQLSQILITLNMLLNTTSVTTLQEISFTTNKVLNEQKRTQSQVLAVLPELAVATSQMRQRIEESQATQLELIRLLSHVRQANLTCFFREGNLLLKDVDGPTGQLINPRPRMASDYERKLRKGRNPRVCQRYCRCNCHETKRISTPWTLRKYIGLGSMGISSCDSLQKCNIKGCKQSASSSLRLEYVLPSWFTLRMVSLWYNYSPLHGPELLLRVPVVLPWPAWDAAWDDYMHFCQMKSEHMHRWLHTPTYTDEFGGTLFYWAIYYGHYDIINHLLDMGVDLHQRTYCGASSSYDLLWQALVSDQTSCVTQRVEAVSKVDWDDYIEDGGLAELHLIIRGLRNRDLETHIRAHPEELEQKDARGCGSLYYASIFGKLADIRTLLKYGAILNRNTFNLSYFLSRFGSKAFDFMDEHLSPGVLRCLFEGGCARNWFLDDHGPQTDIDEILAVDKLCFEYGFDVNYEIYGGKTLLMAMLHGSYWCLPLRVKQLLDHGADLELTDNYGKTALHHCIEAYRDGDICLKLLNMLVEHGARLDYRTRDGSTILHAVTLDVWHLEPIKTMLHLDISGLLLDAKDSDGYTAFDLLILRARLLRQDSGDCWVSLATSHIVDRAWYSEKYIIVEIQGKEMRIANTPSIEHTILTALEALLHKVQEVQGIPPEEQYPSIESVLDQEDIDAEASRLEGLPGSWPE